VVGVHTALPKRHCGSTRRHCVGDARYGVTAMHLLPWPTPDEARISLGRSSRRSALDPARRPRSSHGSVFRVIMVAGQILRIDSSTLPFDGYPSAPRLPRKNCRVRIRRKCVRLSAGCGQRPTRILVPDSEIRHFRRRCGRSEGRAKDEPTSTPPRQIPALCAMNLNEPHSGFRSELFCPARPLPPTAGPPWSIPGSLL